MNKDVAKCLVAFERKFLRRMFWGINANENWRKQSNKELMQVFGDLDILSSGGISQLNWIGHVNRMDNNRKVNQVFNNNPHSSRLRGCPKNNGGTVYKHILINVKLQIQELKNRADWEKSIKEVKVHIGL